MQFREQTSNWKLGGEQVSSEKSKDVTHLVLHQHATLRFRFLLWKPPFSRLPSGFHGLGEWFSLLYSTRVMAESIIRRIIGWSYQEYLQRKVQSCSMHIQHMTSVWQTARRAVCYWWPPLAFPFVPTNTTWTAAKLPDKISHFTHIISRSSHTLQ